MTRPDRLEDVLERLAIGAALFVTAVCGLMLVALEIVRHLR